MNFGASDPLHDYQIADFGGVDFSTLENKVNAVRSPDAANVLLNHNGYLEKRTGYKRLFKGEDKINGIFDYKPAKADKTFYFMHAGTKLYAISFDASGAIVADKLLLGDLKDCKSRHFVYNDRLYILGCGYIQIYWRDNIIEYGHVNKAGTVDDIAMVEDGVFLQTDSKKREKIFHISSTNTKNADEGEAYANAKELQIPDSSVSVKIDSIQVRSSSTGEWKGWALEYADISADGKIFSLLGNPYYGCVTNSFDERFSFSFSTIKVEYTPDSSIVTPLTIINRTAVPHLRKRTKANGTVVENMDSFPSFNDYKSASFVPSEYVGRLMLDGDAVDAVNFANARRRIQFSVPDEASVLCGYYCYLGDANMRALVHRVSINGTVVHNYKKHYTSAHAIEELHSSIFDTIYIGPQGNFVCVYSMWAYVTRNGDFKYVALPDAVQPGDIIEIEFTPIRDADSDDEQISDCSIYGIYGGNNDTRVFLSGNPKFPNRDYASGLYDATYFPNTMYTDVGSSASAIVGYHKLYSNQIIIKDDATEDASQFLRSLNIDEAGNVTYTLIQGQSTYGACCASSFKNVAGLPFYLGKDGVYTIAGTTVQNQNNTTLRSLQINKRFLQEDLTNAVCCRHENNYVIATGTHMWICDTNHGLEWFYFDGLPEITCIFAHNDRLYFGTADGRICMFAKQEEENAYYDNLNPDGSTEGAVPVKCHWCTPTSAFDNWNMLKTVANVYLSIMPHNDTSVTVYYNSSDDAGEEITTEEVGLFDFDDLNFDNFSFDGIRQPKPFATGVKCKNVYVFGVKLENAEAQPFGIVSIGYKYKYSKYIK